MRRNYMKEIIIEGLVSKAKQMHKEGKKWHFHMLTPECMFNEKNDKHAFVLEGDNDIYVVYSAAYEKKERS